MDHQCAKAATWRSHDLRSSGTPRWRFSSSRSSLRARLGRRPERDRLEQARSMPPRAPRGGSARRSRRARWCPTASIAVSPGLRAGSNEAGRKDHREACVHGEGTAPQAVPKSMVREPCLDPGQAVTLGRLLRKAEDLMGMPVEIEWALDDAGFKLLQARPLHIEPIAWSRTRSGFSIRASRAIRRASAGVPAAPWW